MKADVFRKCQEVFDEWRNLSIDDFDFDDPKGFSSFTMGVRCKRNDVDPPAVLFRGLEGKENAILDFDRERETFLLLGEHQIAAHCYHYDDTCRIEQFYVGRTLVAADMFDVGAQRGLANELYRFHQLKPENLPDETFFELLHQQWGEMAQSVLCEHRPEFPAHERELCEELTAIYSQETHKKVMRCLPDRDPVFCHNDTYHGNVMLLADGSIKLLDFEFSCLNHITFDFGNLFAETVMQHGLADPPHFAIAEPEFSDHHLASLIGFYLDNAKFDSAADRETELAALVSETRGILMLSDYMYAMAALPLSLEPIQKLRFIPYAHQRFKKFLRAWDVEYPKLTPLRSDSI